VLVPGRDVLDDVGEEDFEVAFGVPTAAGAVDDGVNKCMLYAFQD
jgi:hypothetical protein